MEVRERKIRLRSKMREAVGAAFESVIERRQAEEKLVSGLDRLVQDLRLHEPMGLWAFWPTMAEEPDFRPWLTGLMVRGTKIGLPRLNWDDRTLEFHQVIDPMRDLEIDAKGLAQPRADLPEFEVGHVAAILVPGLAFDESGGRLGRAAGFYDRTLGKVPEHVKRIGICFDLQVIDEVPQDSWDRKVNAILSPDRGLRKCRDDLAGQTSPR